jgi:hypothetical protein
VDFRRHRRRTPTPAAPEPKAVRPSSGRNGHGARSDGVPAWTDDDWRRWLRDIERKRRLAARSNSSLAPLPDYLVRATSASFRLEGLDVSESDVAAALSGGRCARGLRSRQVQRLRNHAAILAHVETAVRAGKPLTSDGVVRWYTSVSCGLSTNDLDESAKGRIDGVARQINSPQLRPQPAVREVARLHAQILSDPLVPSFNGILARLLLRYHLGRCGLPPVVFAPDTPAACLAKEAALLPLLLTAIDASYDAVLPQRP